jgi:hypothetical protein
VKENALHQNGVGCAVQYSHHGFSAPSERRKVDLDLGSSVV